MFDNRIQVVPLFGQFWVKTKDKSSEIAAPQSTLTQTALTLRPVSSRSQIQ